MKNFEINITKDPKFVEYLMKVKVIDDKTLRDIEIKHEYEHMKRQRTQKLKSVREMLADKYFTSEKTIESVLYDDEETKLLILNLNQSSTTIITLKK